MHERSGRDGRAPSDCGVPADLWATRRVRSGTLPSFDAACVRRAVRPPAGLVLDDIVVQNGPEVSWTGRSGDRCEERDAPPPDCLPPGISTDPKGELLCVFASCPSR